jgi:hypothetical protein
MYIKLIIAVLMISTSLYSSSSKTYHNQTGDLSYYYSVTQVDLSNDKHKVMVDSEHIKESFVISYDASTLKWDHENKETSTNVSVVRKNNRLILNGHIYNTVFKGKVEQIDNNPWFQSLNTAIQRFVKSNKNEQVFWLLSDKSLTLHQMIAKEKKYMTLVIDGESVDAIQVEITFPGWGGLFWSAHYWFRRSDVQFLRYEGRNGPPGTKETIITYLD